jgi:hypothetical protein
MAGARPTKFTRSTLDRLFVAIRAGLPYHLAAEAAGISYQTFNEWQHGRFPRGADTQLKAEFSDQLTRARGGSALRLISIVNRAAPDDWRAASWILERRFPKDFGKQTLEVTGADGAPMQVEVATLQRVMLKALEHHPEARVDVARALVEADGHARSA